MATWKDPCSHRGTALSHAHWIDCKPPAPHPGTDDVHHYSQCCHCAMVIDGVEDPFPGMADHAFVPTLYGTCQRCRLGPSRHESQVQVTLATTLEEAEECSISHAALTLKLVETASGTQWSKCPGCGDILEPKLATGKPEGRRWGLGRGSFGPRDQARVLSRVGWRAWLAQHGGGELE